MRERAGARRRPSGADASRPVYIISVAAELVSVHPRTLRIYEKKKKLKGKERKGKGMVGEGREKEETKRKGRGREW